ncbi:hypothetical protein THRCLA_02193 [Thraustotheca clavata]|uniref:Phosphoribulokinase/uridine kinase domain-containing protein n=1 Tax=Thraustotheca clavata TaxID=74557 RepID=A0A1W0A682_9STRA|nr:hypothetical protein THRCLA_02193 [Thraustotheca clavata]
MPLTPARTQELAAALEKIMHGSGGLSTLRGSHDPFHALVHNYYLPVFAWVDDIYNNTPQPPTRHHCVVLGISCVQGGGKTTMTKYLEKLFRHTGKKCATVSIDDVYYPRQQQLSIAAANAGNPLLEMRGNPGTHDIKLLLDLIKRAKDGKDVTIPRYDKSAHNGLGDRAPKDKWIFHQGPLDILLVEGWCLGFEASKRCPANPHLVPINEALREFTSIYNELDAMLVVQVGDAKWVYKWREEAEADMRAEGKPAMTPAQVRDFVDRFMPTYDEYLEPFYDSMTSPSAPATTLSTKRRMVAAIDSTRSCVFMQDFS